MARTLRVPPLLLLVAAALTAASFLHCDEHLGSCEPDQGPAEEPVLARLLPAQQPAEQPAEQPAKQPEGQPATQPAEQPATQPAKQPTGQHVGQRAEQPATQPAKQPARQPAKQPAGQPAKQPAGQPAKQPAGSQPATSDRRRTGDNTLQGTPAAPTTQPRTTAPASGITRQTVTSEPVSNSKRQSATQSGVPKDASRRHHGDASPRQETPVAVNKKHQQTPTAEDRPKVATHTGSVAKPPALESKMTQTTPEQPPANKVEVPVQQGNVATKTEQQRTAAPSESATRKKREVASDIPSQRVVVPSPKSDAATVQRKGVKTDSSHSDVTTSQQSASEGQRKAVVKTVNSISTGAKEATGKPSASNVNSVQDSLPAKEASKQGKHVTEKQNRQQEVAHLSTKPKVQKRDLASVESKPNSNTVNKHQTVKSRSAADDRTSQSEREMPKTSKQSEAQGNDQKEVVKRFRPSEESHVAGKAQETRPVKSQDSHHQQNLQGEIRKTEGSSQGKDFTETKSRSVAAPNKIQPDTYKEKVKDQSSKLPEYDSGKYDAASNKVIASVIRNTQQTLARSKNNGTSQLKHDINIQGEKLRVRREISDDITFSVINDSSPVDTDHFGEMHLNESVKNATIKKFSFSNISASLADSYKPAATTIIVDGNIFKGPGSKTWKLSSITNTSENEVSTEATIGKKSAKQSGSSFAETKSLSSEKSNESGSRVNTSESDKTKELEESPEVPIIPSSNESASKSTQLSKPETSQTGVQIKHSETERNNGTRGKSTDVREISANVSSDEEAPMSSPSRGESTLRIKRDTAGEVKLAVTNESIRVDTPTLVEQTKTNINTEKQPQVKETDSSESQEVTKSKEDNKENVAPLSKGMKSPKTESVENGTDSRKGRTTDEQKKEPDERKDEESIVSVPLHVPDTGTTTSESVTELSTGLSTQEIPKGEPVSQRLVSSQERDDYDESKPLTEPVATEKSAAITGKGKISFGSTERSEEPKPALLSEIISTSGEVSSESGTDTSVLIDGSDTGADVGRGEAERGGPVAEAILSQPPEMGGPSGDSPEAQLKDEPGNNLAGAVAHKWVMPDPSGRAEENREQAAQPQEEVDAEEAERLLVLADRLRQRDGGRRDVEDDRDLDEPQLHFPSVPPGEDFHAAELGLSDGIFLFGYLSTFISWLQPHDFPVELVRDALWNRVSLTDLITETLQVEVGFIAVLSVGVALALAVPVVALGLTCCRLLEARADCRDHEPSACRRRTLLCSLWTVLLLMAVGVAAMFASNEQVSAAVQWSPRVLHTALSDTAAFVRSTHHQIGFVASKSLDQALAAAVDDLDSADALLGAPIQRELSRETGVDVALDALSDVSAAAEGASQRAAAVLEQAAQARGLALVARERLADLRYQLDAARRQCAARDRPLCDTVDAIGLDVSVRLETLLNDDRLLALRDLRNGNLSAAAQQARADYQLLPRQVLETTRDARLGIRRELVRERANLQDALTPLDAFSRSVSGRVDGARAAAQDAARMVAEADYWRWLTGLGAALSMLVIWLLLAAGGGCGCCGSQEKARPLLITAVATASVLSLLLWAVTLSTFALGAHAEVLACRPLFSAPDYPQLSRLVDRPGVLFSSGGFFRNVAGSNASLDVPLKDVLQECELGRPAYEALQLRQLFDSDAATGRGGQWEGVRQQVSRLRVDLAELRVLTPGLQAQLEDTLRAASANLTQHRLALQGPVTNRDLQALADQLLSVSSQVADLSSASRLETLAARAKRLLSSHISPLEQRKEDLVYQLTALEVALAPLQRQTNQSLSHLKTIQYFVGKQGESIARAAVRRYAERLLGYLQQARAHVLAQVGRRVAPCRPLFDVFHAARQLLCRHAIDPLNGLWFSSAWCLVLLVAAVPLSLRLADAYRRRDTSASLLSSRNSESPSEAVDIPDNWNTPGGGQQQQDGW